MSSIGSGTAAFKTPPNYETHPSGWLKRRRGSSPCRKSVRVNYAKTSCKSLFASTAQPSQQALNECIDSNFNIDDLPTDGALQVKEVITDKTGKPTTTNPQEEESKQIVQCDNCV